MITIKSTSIMIIEGIILCIKIASIMLASLIVVGHFSSQALNQNQVAVISISVFVIIIITWILLARSRSQQNRIILMEHVRLQHKNLVSDRRAYQTDQRMKELIFEKAVGEKFKELLEIDDFQPPLVPPPPTLNSDNISGHIASFLNGAIQSYDVERKKYSYSDCGDLSFFKDSIAIDGKSNSVTIPKNVVSNVRFSASGDTVIIERTNKNKINFLLSHNIAPNEAAIVIRWFNENNFTDYIAH